MLSNLLPCIDAPFQSPIQNSEEPKIVVITSSSCPAVHTWYKISYNFMQTDDPEHVQIFPDMAVKRTITRSLTVAALYLHATGTVERRRGAATGRSPLKGRMPRNVASSFNRERAKKRIEKNFAGTYAHPIVHRQYSEHTKSPVRQGKRLRWRTDRHVRGRCTRDARGRLESPPHPARTRGTG